MTNPVLSVRDLSISVPRGAGSANAVEGVSFDIQPGSRVGLVGESGCGKSLTALALMRLLKEPVRIESGSITMDGTDLVGQSPRDLQGIRGARMAMVYQNPMTALNPVVRVGRQISEVLELHLETTRASARSRALELLRDVGIATPARVFEAYPHELSGGIRQRVVVAMAMSCDPQIVIADEPTTALDVTTQAKVLDLMRRLSDAHGTAFVLITHDLGVAAEFCHEIQVMYAGRIVERGRVSEIFEAPKHPYTQGLLASRVELGTDRATPLATIGGYPPQPGRRPGGCDYHPRCPIAVPECRTTAPAAVGTEIPAVSCLRAGESRIDAEVAG